MSNSRNKIFLLAILFVFAALAIQSIDFRLTNIRGGDSVSYLLLIKSLATGNGYSDINIPSHPFHTQYPPLLPLILSPFYFFLGFNFAWMKFVIFAFGLGTVYAAKRFFEKEEDAGAGLAIAALTATNFNFLFFTGEILTEIPYAFLSILALFFLSRYANDPRIRPYSIIMPLVTAAAYFTRMIGVTLYAATVAVLVLNLRSGKTDKGAHIRKLVFFIVSAALPFIIWSALGKILSQGDSSYGSIFMKADYYADDSGAINISSLLSRAATNIGYYLDAFPLMLYVNMSLKKILPHAVLKIIETFLSITLLAGFASSLYRKRGVKEFYIMFYLLILTIWPVYGLGDSARYLIPLIPFIYYYLISGFRFLGSFCFKGSDGSKWAVILVLIFFSFVNLFKMQMLLQPLDALKRINNSISLLSKFEAVQTLTPELMGIDNFSGAFPCYSNYLQASFDLKDRVEETGVVMTRKPEVLALLSERYSVKIPFTKDEKSLFDFMERMKAGFVLTDSCYPESGIYVEPLITAHPERFRLLADEGRGARLYRYLNAPASRN